GTDAARQKLERRQHPRLAQDIEDIERQLRRASVAGAKLVDGTRQLAVDLGRVDAELFEDAHQVGVGRLDQLEEEVLQLDVVVGARQAQSGRPFESAPRGLVEFANEGFQV